MANKIQRRTVDLSEYPDLVVIYLGMRVNVFSGLKTLVGLGPKISKSVAAQPDGLLLHENMVYSLFPPNVGMRQYWRSFETLENWSRSEPHKQWWQMYLRDTGGTGFWHETYFMRGGIEAIYDEMKIPLGLSKFAPIKPARGPMFSARKRLNLQGVAESEAPVPETDYELQES